MAVMQALCSNAATITTYIPPNYKNTPPNNNSEVEKTVLLNKSEKIVLLSEVEKIVLLGEVEETCT